MALVGAVGVVAAVWGSIVAQENRDDAYQAALREWLAEPCPRRVLNVRIPQPPPLKLYHGDRVGFVVYEN